MQNKDQEADEIVRRLKYGIDKDSLASYFGDILSEEIQKEIDNAIMKRFQELLGRVDNTKL